MPDMGIICNVNSAGHIPVVRVVRRARRGSIAVSASAARRRCIFRPSGVRPPFAALGADHYELPAASRIDRGSGVGGKRPGCFQRGLTTEAVRNAALRIDEPPIRPKLTGLCRWQRATLSVSRAQSHVYPT